MVRLKSIAGFAAAGLGLFVSATSVNAALLASDAFDYSTGSTLGAQSSATGGWRTGWMSNAGLTIESTAAVLEDSLSAPLGYAPEQTGGSAIQEAMLLYRGLDSSAFIDLSIDKDYYISYLAQRTPVPITTRSYGFVLQTGGVVGGDTVGVVGSSTGGDPYAALGSSGTVVEDLNLVGNGTPVLWVVKVAARASEPDEISAKVYNYATLSIEESEPATWDVVSNTESSDAVATQVAFTMGAGATLQVDEFRLGESWEDVVPVVSTSLEGDLNSDGFVGVDDLNIVLVNWNQNVTPGDLSSGDPTGEGFVGVDDLNIVLVNWNNGTPPASASVVPEPASIAMLGASGLALFRRRRA